MYQLAVLCREILAEWSAGRRNLVEDLSWYLFNRLRFEVYLKGLGKAIYCCITTGTKHPRLN